MLISLRYRLAFLPRLVRSMSSTPPPPPTTTSHPPPSLPAQLTSMAMSNTHFQAFQGNPLNKLHLHRKDEAHIASLTTVPRARFLLLSSKLQPLLRTLPALPPSPPSSTIASSLLPPVGFPLSTRAVIAWLTLPQLTALGLPLVPPTPTSPLTLLLGQVDNEAPIAKTVTTAGHVIPSGDPPTTSTPTSSLSAPPTSSPLPPNDGSLEEDAPYHAVLLPDHLRPTVLSHLSSLPSPTPSPSTYDFHELRSALPLLNYTDASILAQARALMEWHQSALVCGKCGSPTISLEGGGKRQCTAPPRPPRTDAPNSFLPPSTSSPSPSPSLPPTNGGSSPAPSGVVYCGRTIYPRTDAVTITLVVSHDGQRALLGRKREFPAGVWTCLAGFLEGGETPEEGARREVWEETGVTIGPVRYFASQPWPFLGGQLMMGYYGQSMGVEGEEVRLLDGELEAAKWFTREQIGDMLRVSRSKPEGWAKPEAFNGAVRVPPCYAIAHQLIAHWYAFGADLQEGEVATLTARGVRYDNTDLAHGTWISHL